MVKTILWYSNWTLLVNDDNALQHFYEHPMPPRVAFSPSYKTLEWPGYALPLSNTNALYHALLKIPNSIDRINLSALNCLYL